MRAVREWPLRVSRSSAARSAAPSGSRTVVPQLGAVGRPVPVGERLPERVRRDDHRVIGESNREAAIAEQRCDVFAAEEVVGQGSQHGDRLVVVQEESEIDGLGHELGFDPTGSVR